MNTREAILSKISLIKAYHNGFNKGTMRWRNIFIKNQHISEVDFNSLSDMELVDEFETIIRRHYVQM